MQHRGAAQFGGGRQSVPIHVIQPPCVRVHLLSRSREALDRQFFKTLTNPVQPWRGGNIFEGEYQVDAFLWKGMSVGPRGWRGLLRSDMARRREKKDGEDKLGGYAGS